MLLILRRMASQWRCWSLLKNVRPPQLMFLWRCAWTSSNAHVKLFTWFYSSKCCRPHSPLSIFTYCLFHWRHIWLNAKWKFLYENLIEKKLGPISFIKNILQFIVQMGRQAPPPPPHPCSPRVCRVYHVNWWLGV